MGQPGSGNSAGYLSLVIADCSGDFIQQEGPLMPRQKITLGLSGEGDGG